MRIRLPFAYILTFLLLTLLMLELHETAHIVTGWLVCGCWGARDFNVWGICDGCSSTHSLYWLPTLAGPVFSFACMWIGMRWLSSSNKNKMMLGFSLIFANIPLGRISEAMKGAGDEMIVTRHLLEGSMSRSNMILLCSVVLLVLGLPPVIKAFRILTNKNSWLYILGFLTLPVAFILAYVLIGMNSLLKTGFLSETGIMGTPLLITVHTLAVLLLLLLFRKKLFLLAAK